MHGNDVSTGSKLAEKIRSRVQRHSFPQIGSMTCSFGVAPYHPDETAETLIRHADEAMYVAKQTGRNRVETR